MNSSTIPKIAYSTKDSKKQLSPQSRDLRRLLLNSRSVIFAMNTVFPFDLFPDQITIEANQINFAKKSFFANYHIQSIPIKNVADVLLSTSIFFASLKVIDSSYIENSIQVDFLHKIDAIKARKIIQGLVIASKNDIDLSKIDMEELSQATEMIGEAQDIDM